MKTKLTKLWWLLLVLAVSPLCAMGQWGMVPVQSQYSDLWWDAGLSWLRLHPQLADSLVPSPPYLPPPLHALAQPDSGLHTLVGLGGAQAVTGRQRHLFRTEGRLLQRSGNLSQALAPEQAGNLPRVWNNRQGLALPDMALQLAWTARHKRWRLQAMAAGQVANYQLQGVYQLRRPQGEFDLRRTLVETGQLTSGLLHVNAVKVGRGAGLWQVDYQLGYAGLRYARSGEGDYGFLGRSAVHVQRAGAQRLPVHRLRLAWQRPTPWHGTLQLAHRSQLSIHAEPSATGALLDNDQGQWSIVDDMVSSTFLLGRRSYMARHHSQLVWRSHLPTRPWWRQDWTLLVDYERHDHLARLRQVHFQPSPTAQPQDLRVSSPHQLGEALHAVQDNAWTAFEDELPGLRWQSQFWAGRAALHWAWPVGNHWRVRQRLEVVRLDQQVQPDQVLLADSSLSHRQTSFLVSSSAQGKVRRAYDVSVSLDRTVARPSLQQLGVQEWRTFHFGADRRGEPSLGLSTQNNLHLSVSRSLWRQAVEVGVWLRGQLAARAAYAQWVDQAKQVVVYAAAPTSAQFHQSLWVKGKAAGRQQQLEASLQLSLAQGYFGQGTLWGGDTTRQELPGVVPVRVEAAVSWQHTLRQGYLKVASVYSWNSATWVAVASGGEGGLKRGIYGHNLFRLAYIAKDMRIGTFEVCLNNIIPINIHLHQYLRDGSSSTYVKYRMPWQAAITYRRSIFPVR